jgi:hypothetical protein
MVMLRTPFPKSPDPPRFLLSMQTNALPSPELSVLHLYVLFLFRALLTCATVTTSESRRTTETKQTLWIQNSAVLDKSSLQKKEQEEPKKQYFCNKRTVTDIEMEIIILKYDSHSNVVLTSEYLMYERLNCSGSYIWLIFSSSQVQISTARRHVLAVVEVLSTCRQPLPYASFSISHSNHVAVRCI